MAAEQEEIPDNIASAITEITERATLLIRDEIELARAEIAAKLRKLLTGAVVGIVAGVFVLVAGMFILEGLAWDVRIRASIEPANQCGKTATGWLQMALHAGLHL